MFHFIASGVRLYLDGTISILVKSETLQVVTYKIDKCFFGYYKLFNQYHNFLLPTTRRARIRA